MLRCLLRKSEELEKRLHSIEVAGGSEAAPEEGLVCPNTTSDAEDIDPMMNRIQELEQKLRDLESRLA